MSPPETTGEATLLVPRVETLPTGEVRLWAKTAALWEDPANVRLHDGKNLAAIEGSLKEYGQQKPVVVEATGKVVAGNGTLRAAKAIGLEEMWVTVTDQTGARLVGYGIADNRSAEHAGWNYDVLAGHLHQQIEASVDLGSQGWTAPDLKFLLEEEWQPPAVDPDFQAYAKRAAVVVFTPEQKVVVDRAVAWARLEKGSQNLTEGEALAYVCTRWLDRP